MANRDIDIACLKPFTSLTFEVAKTLGLIKPEQVSHILEVQARKVAALESSSESGAAFNDALDKARDNIAHARERNYYVPKGVPAVMQIADQENILSKKDGDQILTVQAAARNLQSQESLLAKPVATEKDKEMFAKDIGKNARPFIGAANDLPMLKRAQCEGHLADILVAAVKINPELAQVKEVSEALKELGKGARNSLLDGANEGRPEVNFGIAIELKDGTGNLWQGERQKVNYGAVEQGLKKASELLKDKGATSEEQQKSMDEVSHNRVKMAQEAVEGKQADISKSHTDSIAMTDLPRSGSGRSGRC
jgi:hypothetical protein